MLMTVMTVMTWQRYLKNGITDTCAQQGDIEEQNHDDEDQEEDIEDVDDNDDGDHDDDGNDFVDNMPKNILLFF